MDQEIDVDPVTALTGTFVDPTSVNYGATAVGKLQFSYPETSTGQVDQKAMARISGGYSATSTPPLSFGSHTLLWYNPLINLYILQQPSVSTGTATTISMNGLTNPEPYQKE